MTKPPTYFELAALIERAVLRRIDEEWLLDAKAALWDIKNSPDRERAIVSQS